MKNRIRIVLWAAWFLCVAGCGYHFQGATAPEGATVEIPVFENRTIETGIEATVTDQVIAEMRRTPGWTVVPPGQGHYVLRGIIVQFVAEPHLVSPQHIEIGRRATLVLDVRFQERATNKDLWRERSLRTFQDYTVGNDILADERRKLDTITRIANELASRIRVRVQDTW